MATVAREKVQDEVSLARDFIRQVLSRIAKGATIRPEDLLKDAAAENARVSNGALIDAVWDLAELGELALTKDWQIRRSAA